MQFKQDSYSMTCPRCGVHMNLKSDFVKSIAALKEHYTTVCPVCESMFLVEYNANKDELDTCAFYVAYDATKSREDKNDD